MKEIYSLRPILGKRLFKWFAFFYLNFKAFTAYRFNNLSYLFTQLIVLSGTLIIWYYNITSGSTGIRFSEILTYYLVGQICIIQIDPHWSIAEDIQHGQFSNKLIKPASVWLSYLVEDIGVNFFTNLIKISLSLSIFLIFLNQATLPKNLMTWVFFFLSLIIAYSFNILISFFSSFVTFYTINSHGILEFFVQFKQFFSGWYFPLNILPFLRPLVFLPFAFTYYHPLQIFLNQYSQEKSAQVIVYGLIMLGFSFIATSIFYKRGLKNYESIGL